MKLGTYEVAKAGRLVPSSGAGVNVHIAQAADHLLLVVGVDLGAGSDISGRGVLLVVLVVLSRGVDGGEGERVGDLEFAIDVHTYGQPSANVTTDIV